MDKNRGETRCVRGRGREGEAEMRKQIKKRRRDDKCARKKVEGS